MSKDYPWGKGTPTWVRDAALNDSDKSFTVPTGKIWVLKYIRGELTATATVGNRILMVNITNGTSVVYTRWAGTNIAATQVGIIEMHFDSFSDEFAIDSLVPTSTVARGIGVCSMVLPAGYVVRVLDNGAIDAAADDLTVVLHYVEYDA